MLTIITKSVLGKHICLDSNFLFPSFNCPAKFSVTWFKSDSQIDISVCPVFFHFAWARQQTFAQPKQNVEINLSSATPHCTMTGGTNLDHNYVKILKSSLSQANIFAQIANFFCPVSIAYIESDIYPCLPSLFAFRLGQTKHVCLAESKC